MDHALQAMIQKLLLGFRLEIYDAEHKTAPVYVGFFAPLYYLQKVLYKPTCCI